MTDKKNSFDEEKFERMIEEGVKKLENIDCKDKKGFKRHSSSGIAGGVYCLGFIGAVVYFIQQADSFGTGVIGFLKALVWPAFLIYNLLDFLKI
jgi:hypothetical protein